MAKIIKEIIIMLLICLISMLVLAVVLYDYIPNRKVVAEITQYETSEEINTQLADDIDSEEKEVVLTYEVTSSDLSTYESRNEYVPGKANPFSAATKSTDENNDDDTNSTGGNSTSGGNSTKTDSSEKDENNSFTSNETIK